MEISGWFSFLPPPHTSDVLQISCMAYFCALGLVGVAKLEGSGSPCDELASSHIVSQPNSSFPPMGACGMV